ncbi:hypothetical protein [Corynebacterium auriscanis]|uniref:hypothetical protein n=1 Tax=Corynebacterium auriscanis TaxID=99807 RepID=UPI0022478B9D|nr:hypothetical protein [Corynebacterium auriscanis]MCX2164062.1 hypothetical protein [Corynebacterium auriscanis]
MGGAAGDEFFDVGSGGDQACVAGTEQLMWTMTGDAGDRPGAAPTWRPSWWASDATRSAYDRA